MNTERRQGIRIPLVFPLECHKDGSAVNDPPMQAMTCRDLSSGGMSLTSSMTLEVGKSFLFCLSLPHEQAPERFSGQVRWCAGPSLKTKVGIRFAKPLDFSVPLSAATEAVGNLQDQMKTQNRLLEQMVRVLENESPGQLVVLDTDLNITDVRGARARGSKKEKRKTARFRGKNLQKATGLAETKVNGKRLLDVLEMCARTGQEFAAKRCRYGGRSGRTSDLFSPGFFRARISPICDPENRVCSLLMSVTKEDPLIILDRQGNKGRENTKRFAKILGAAATGVLLKDVLTHSRNPLTLLHSELDLVRNKLKQDADIRHPQEKHKGTFQTTGIKKAQQSVAEVFQRFDHLLQDQWAYNLNHLNHAPINECLLRAIDTVKMYEELAEDAITCKMEQSLPSARINAQELTMVFLIFLAFSKNCLSNVSNKEITCETSKKGKLLVARISHNGFIPQHSLDILFHDSPLEGFFLNDGSASVTDTLLYYANFLLKKNAVCIKLTNIPGCFDLSLLFPAVIQ